MWGKTLHFFTGSSSYYSSEQALPTDSSVDKNKPSHDRRSPNSTNNLISGENKPHSWLMGSCKVDEELMWKRW